MKPPSQPKSFCLALSLRQVLRPLSVAADVLVYSQTEINQQQDACSSAVYWALREGKVLYVTQRIERAQRLLTLAERDMTRFVR